MVEKGGTSAVFTTALTEAGAEQAVEDEGEEEEDAGEGEEEDAEVKEEGGTEVEVGELAASASSVAGGLHLFFFFLDFLAPAGSSTPAPGAAPPPFLFPFFFPPTDCCDERPMSGAGEAGSLSMVDAPLLLVSGHQTPYRAIGSREEVRAAENGDSGDCEAKNGDSGREVRACCFM